MPVTVPVQLNPQINNNNYTFDTKECFFPKQLIYYNPSAEGSNSEEIINNNNHNIFNKSQNELSNVKLDKLSLGL